MTAPEFEYRIFTYPEAARPVEITKAVISLEWGDLKAELAAHAVLTLAALKADELDMADAVKLNTEISILVNKATVFQGVIWDYTISGSGTIRINCYDRLIYLSGSRDNAYFPRGSTTENVISSICSKWSIPLVYTYRNCSHAGLSYRALTIAEQLRRTLDATRAICGVDYMLRLEDGRLHVGERGGGGAVCTLRHSSAIDYTHRLSLDDMVTRVVISSMEKNGPIRTGAALDGDITFGVLQAVVDGVGISAMDARRQAETLLNEHGRPAECISVECIDVPALRRGDRVSVDMDTLSGEYDVLGIAHSGASVMRAELGRHMA